jgi:hypothetical protein
MDPGLVKGRPRVAGRPLRVGPDLVELGRAGDARLEHGTPHVVKELDEEQLSWTVVIGFVTVCSSTPPSRRPGALRGGAARWLSKSRA